MLFTDKDKIKIILYVDKHKSVSKTKLLKKFSYLPESENAINFLINQGILNCNAPYDRRNGQYIYADDTLFTVDINGRDILENWKSSRHWFDLKFVLTQIVLPIAIAIITTLITIYLTTLLSPSL